MTNQNQFQLATHKNLKTLIQYVPIVDRVHGSHHPEFHDVRRVFETMVNKINAAGSNVPQLNEEFAELRSISSNYAVPSDVCETYEAVYNMLSEVDTAYHAQ